MMISFCVIFSETSQCFALNFQDICKPFGMVFEETREDFCADFSGDLRVTVIDNIAPYIGEYEVTPKVMEQTLETENKRMTEDLTVKKIPYFEVSNLTGGNTVYIGSEVS